uniref:2-dehydro-3-deoxygalactonokinase n=1 Tax=Paenirhodobacter enshiensis TaxID=1105367 RepID=UPI0035B2E12F
MSAAPSVHPDWIAVDWGTSNLRVYAVADDGRVLAEAASAAGMGGLAPEGFEPELLRLIGGWLGGRNGANPMPVVVCGMAGARGAWIEAPYRATPCPPVVAGETVTVPTLRRDIAVEIVPGLSQRAPADVMRGEETQIAGFLASEPGFAGLLILPGTHSKHVRLGGGEVLGFATHMTGEVFAALSNHTVLSRTLGTAAEEDEAAFDEGLATGRAGGALGALFALRAGALLDGLSAASARSRLSGLLLGAELAGIASGTGVVVIGSGALARRYGHALAAQGVDARLSDGGELARRGLALARKSIATATEERR